MDTDQSINCQPTGSLKQAVKQFCLVVVFSIAFGYIEAAVVVYLRTIFYPDGFTFPLLEFGVAPLWKQLLAVEIAREAATLVLISAGSWLFGKNLQQRLAFFLIIFAVWDIFYYVWLKVILNWPVSLMDWDILFLIPIPWASPVWAPLLISFTMLLFAVIILYKCSCNQTLKITKADRLGLILSLLVLVVSFCLGGLHISEPDYQAHFPLWIFLPAYISATLISLKCVFLNKS